MGGGTGEPARIGRRRQRSSGLSQRPPVDLDMVLALSAVPTAVLGPSGKIANANDAFWSWSGYDAHQLVGRRVHDLLDPADHAGFDHDLQRLGWPGRADRRARAERAVLAADGRRRWAVVDLVALPPDTGQARLVSQWTDVSELRDLEERQRQRALEDGELASFVSALVRADDPEAVLTEAAARVAAVVGDTCAVFRADGTRRLREFTWQTRRPDALDPTRPLSADLSTRSVAADPLASVLRTGRRVAQHAADPAALRDQLPDQFRRPLDRFGVSSAVFVPVRVFGAVAGVVVTYRFAGSPPYTAQDVAFLDEFGVHASLAFERATLDERLRESAERLRICLDVTSDAVAVLQGVRDESGTIVDFECAHINEAGCRLAGRPRERIVGQRLGLAGSPGTGAAGGTQPGLFAAFRAVAESGQPLARTGIRHAGGFLGGPAAARRYDLRATRLGDEVVLAWRDVTEQTEHVAALERHARHHEVLAAASAALAHAGSDLDRVNSAVVRQLVTHLGDLAGVALLSADGAALDPVIAFGTGGPARTPTPGVATRPIPLAAVGPRQRAFHSGEPVTVRGAQAGQSLGLAPEHARLISHLRMTDAVHLPLRTGSGPIGVLTVGRIGARAFAAADMALLADIAERAALAIDGARLSAANEEAHRSLQASEAELRRSNQDLEQFAYLVSHDLQAPLRTIRGYLDVVAKKLAQRAGAGGDGDEAGEAGEAGEADSDGSVDDYVRAVAAGVSRMQERIRGLLAYSRIASRGHHRGLVDVNVLMGSVLAGLRGAIDETGATVTHDPLPTIAVDAGMFEQLLQNLIENAIKFRGAEAPVVHVSARREPNGWAFSVTDNRIGLDPARSERIFEVFHRLHPEDRYPGTGIGLAIGSKIVKQHGGAMRVFSAPGQGATFHFTIPDPGAEGQR